MPNNTPTNVAPAAAKYSLIYSYSGASGAADAARYQCRVQYNPSRDFELMVDVQESLYFGRRAPVAEYGDAFYDVGQFSFFIPYFDPLTGQYGDENWRSDPAAIAAGYQGPSVTTMLRLLVRNQQQRQWATAIQDPTGIHTVPFPGFDPDPDHPTVQPLIGHIGNLKFHRDLPNNWIVTFTFSELDVAFGI